MKQSKIIVKYVKILCNKKFAPDTDFNLILSSLNEQEALIISNFKKLVILKSKVPYPKFFYDKKFSWDKHGECIEQFNVYLKQFEVFSDLVRAYKKDDYGVYLTKAIKLLAKVKYENH